jgi:NADPH-dependent curcumin reductase CurA
LTGTSEKVRLCVERFGFAVAANYREDDLDAFLDREAASGLNVFFDNTGGPILDRVVRRMVVGGRIVQCGTASIASWDPPPTGPRIEREVLTRRLRWSGFVIFDHRARFEEAVRVLDDWRRQGQLTLDEDVTDRIEEAPAALAGLYRGENRGKRLIHLG